MRQDSFIDFLYDKYYEDNPELRRIVLTHSQMVAQKAIEIAILNNLPISHEEIKTSALLHDIGVVKCDAADIKATGNQPYIRHGIAGKEMLMAHGLDKYARICERHTGSGLSAKEIVSQNLPLPAIDMLPETILEKLICYADKFFSKSGNLTKEKDIETVKKQMLKFGHDSYERFMKLHDMFSPDKSVT